MSQESSFAEPKSPQLPTPKGKIRCHTCEQTVKNKEHRCPHCLSFLGVQMEDTPIDEAVFEREVEKLKRGSSTQRGSHEELLRVMFARAMELRFKEPSRSKELFYQVILYAPNNSEARIKASWLELRLGKIANVCPLLHPVVTSLDANLEQKQRAYNYMAQSSLYKFPPDLEAAETYSKQGIELDGKGTRRLWTYYATTLRYREKLTEALEAYSKALYFDPKCTHTLENIQQVENQIRRNAQRKKSKKSKEEVLYSMDDEVDKENFFSEISSNGSMRSTLKTGSTKSSSFGKKRSLSLRLLTKLAQNV